MAIKNVGIIGAGQMGLGIAHVAAAAGYDVIMNDISEEQLSKATDIIAKNLDRQIKKEKISEADKEKTLSNITTSTDIKDLFDCDLVIEAATEREEIKFSIFEKLSKIVKDDCYIASNTSSLSITKLASYTKNPEKFMGVHFMNPVPMMKLVELIKGLATSEETYKDMHEFVTSLGKIIAVSNDVPAFIVNRILITMINEAIYALYENVGDVVSIDNALTLGAAHPMGPLQLADFIGLDTCLAIMETLHREMGDTKYRPSPLLRKYVEAGWLGKKTKKGFYDYSGETPIPSK